MQYLEDDLQQAKGDCVFRTLRKEYVDNASDSGRVVAKAVGEPGNSRHENGVFCILGFVGGLDLSDAAYDHSKTFGRGEGFPFRGGEFKLLQTAFSSFECCVGGCIEARD